MLTSEIINKIESRFNCKLSHLYLYGSHVYGTQTETSDIDLIGVANIDGHYLECHHDLDLGFDLTLYSSDYFQEQIDIHEISILECLWLPQDKVLLKGLDWNFKLNLKMLRESISKKSNHAWVKAKKKLQDGEILLAQKSLFHSFRIIQYGIQIAKWNKIMNYADPQLLTQIKLLEPNWDLWQVAFKAEHNKLMSEFRLLAPKV